MSNSLSKSKRLKYLLLNGLIVVFSCPQVWALDFESFYQASLKNSPDLAKANAKYHEAELSLALARANFFPRLGLEARHEVFESKQDNESGGATNVFLEWNLLKGFQDSRNWHLSKAELSLVNLEKQAIEQGLRSSLVALYVRAQVKQEMVLLYRKAISDSAKHLANLRQRRAAGKISQSDVILFQIYQDKLKQDLETHDAELDQALSDLKLASGSQSLSPLSTRFEPKPIKLQDADLDEFIRDRSPELLSGKVKTESATFELNQSYAGYLPEVNFKVTYGSLGIRETQFNPETTVGVYARWELFSGFETLQNRRLALARLNGARLETEQRQVQLLNLGRQLKRRLQNLYQQHEFQTKNLQRLDSLLQAVQLDYQRGAKDPGDLTEVLEAGLESQLSLLNIRSEFFATKFELEKHLGKEIN